MRAVPEATRSTASWISLLLLLHADAYTPHGQPNPSISPLRAANALSEAHIAAFERDGCVVVRGAFRGHLDDLRAAFDDAMANPGPFAEDLASASDAPPGPHSHFFTDLEMSSRWPHFRAFGKG